MTVGADKAVLRFADRTLDAPTEVGPALEFIVARGTFRVSELPDNLTDASKLVLARRLVREGFLDITAD